MSTTLTKIGMFSAMLTAIAIPAYAAEAGRSNPSEPLVWGFLGLCALIIIAQIAPMISSLKKQSRTAAEQAKAVKHQQLK